MAPSSQSEDVLDLEQISLHEAPLPPPIQRVMDPGQYTYAVFKDDLIWPVLPVCYWVCLCACLSRFFRLWSGSDEPWHCRFGGQAGSVHVVHWHDQHLIGYAWGEGWWNLWCWWVDTAACAQLLLCIDLAEQNEFEEIYWVFAVLSATFTV